MSSNILIIHKHTENSHSVYCKNTVLMTIFITAASFIDYIQE